MNTTALRLSPLALAALFVGSVSAVSQAQTTATTDPVGYYTLSFTGATDNVASLPMIRDAAFAGTVASGAGTITATGFTALAGTVSPNWGTAPKQWVYNAGAVPPQTFTYYCEFTSGTLKGLYYKIVDNTSNVLTLDTEGDDLTNHPVGGAPAALAAGDSFKIRPYWRIRDVFETGGVPIIESRPTFDTPKDDILIPSYVTVGTNKPASVTYYHVNDPGGDGVGWRRVNTEPADKGDDILKPNEAFILRRRNAAPLALTNLGAVNMIRAISFIPGGNGTSGNDTYISITRPASVSLNASGLRNANQAISVIKDSTDGDNPGDSVYAFQAGTGLNRPPTKRYYYLQGAGWRLFPDDVADKGADTLDPGTAYIIRKGATSSGRDWQNDPNY